MAGFSEILSATAGVTTLLYTAWAVWDLLRTPDTLRVTYLPTGRSVVINMKAGYEEGRKLTALLEPWPDEAPAQEVPLP